MNRQRGSAGHVGPALSETFTASAAGSGHSKRNGTQLVSAHVHLDLCETDKN